MVTATLKPLGRLPSLTVLARILRPGGRLAIMWNRRSTIDPLTEGYRRAILDAGGEVAAERMPFDSAVVPDSRVFSATERLTFPNSQRVTLDGLIGRAHSASYVPKTGDRGRQLVASLRDLHARYADAEMMVTLVHETEVYRGHKL